MKLVTKILDKDGTTAVPLTSNEEPTATRSIYSAVDLFAGCGGLGTGLENAGFTTVFVNELDRDAMATYLRNRGHEIGGMRFSENGDLRCHDAHELQGKRLEKLVGDLGDMREVGLHFEQTKLGKMSNLDIVAGGPPCQGYSGIGIRRSYAADKEALPSNRLYARMVKIIDRLRPRVFLFENVRGLLNSRWTRDGTRKIFPDVLAEFRAISGYEVRWSLVYAKDYGVPQNRPRVLLVGIRRDVLEASHLLDKDADPEDAVACGFLPLPTRGYFPDLVDLLGDLVDNSVVDALRSGNFPAGPFETSKYPHKPMNDLQAGFRTPPAWAASRAGMLTEQEYSRHNRDIVEKFDYMLANGGEIPDHARTKKFSQRVLKPRWGNSEPNMTATSLPDDYVHFSQPRILTVREWARLQMFPDWYEFSGKRTTGGIRRAGNPLEGNFDREVPKYTQIGNAVPVGLAEEVGKHFRKILDQAVGTRT
ncbi:DNA (cytosine-5-)-methyltransferase [Novosphingobium sp.]|uniref:DNA cytosine methyltransferase n=1 Tax=Novosphingobium sp. TaxID=1874826 RepID=UPI001D29AD30|nr:DNA (cytosine-5-)-methyltransferase [Novosphingobium sp.]MBX9663725.1 DNA cytosine methyltransferase [Novosphingobium sp.]